MKVNINLTQPIQQTASPVIIDSLGRVIILRKPNCSDCLEFLKALGTELSRNQAYLELASITLLVKSIAGLAITIRSPDDVSSVMEMLELADDALPKIFQAVFDNFLDMEGRTRLINQGTILTYSPLH